ncbi:MAG: [FeFe] hydrogenase, group A [Bacteroidetes bacterium]|nr:[FeFe] hydrogenase, group A [Bacteroidota bacterium]
MIFTIEVNNKQIKAKTGETILSALRRNGIDVPTLCYLPELDATGACRICVVEVEGKPQLVTSCSQPVEEWMKIFTHSPRVIQARKTLIELLLANHPDDCLYCPCNGRCELQHLAGELNVRERRFPNKKSPARLDQTCSALVWDPAKCILCGRCVRSCDEIIGVSILDLIRRGEKISIGTTFEKPLNLSNCITCGQCIQACPTAALREKEAFAGVQEILHKPSIFPVVQYSPVISVSLAEEFGIKPGKDLQGILNSVLRKIGFKKVFDITFAADVLVLELADTLLKRIALGEKLPLISSCCPGWVKYAEQYLPGNLDLLAPLKSPQQIMGKLIKRYYADMQGITPEDIVVTSVMPCTAKKFEAQREEMSLQGTAEVDTVITTRELAKLIRLNGIDINQLDEEMTDSPFASRSTAGKLFGVSGGIVEALIRTLHFRLTMKEIANPKITKIRGFKEKKEVYINIEGKEYGFAAVSTVKALPSLLDEIQSGKKNIQFIEVMACPGGCINGGGQPIQGNGETSQLRAKAIYDIDDKESIKASHKNPAVFDLYQKLLQEPGSPMSSALFTAVFNKRTVLL